MKLPKAQWPRYLLKHTVLKAIYVGSCPENKDSKAVFRITMAHAHSDPKEKHRGSICFCDRKVLIKLVALHEVRAR